MTAFKFKSLLLSLALCSLHTAFAQEALIRKNLAERLPDFPAINEVSSTPMPGLFEVRVNGVELYYTDAQGSYLIEGTLTETKTKRNLTDERVEKLTSVAFDSLPFKDAFTMVRGNGKRKVAVFQDPNCGYCKRFERDLQSVDNVTIYVFLYPILSRDSFEKSKVVWCAKDKAKLWQDYMLRNQPITGATTCDTRGLTRNLEFGRSHHITGTPTLFFANGMRVSGAPNAQQMESALSKVK